MPYGKYNDSDLEVWFGMSAAAGLWLCPPEEYAVEFSVTSNWIWYAWLGALTMRCSGGGIYTADAQPSSPYYGIDGVTSRPDGFKSGTVEAASEGASLFSVFDLGPLAGTVSPATFQCAPGATIRGFSAGAYPPRYDVTEPNSWLMNLQFYCQGPSPPSLPSPPSPPPLIPSSPPEGAIYNFALARCEVFSLSLILCFEFFPCSIFFCSFANFCCLVQRRTAGTARGSRRQKPPSFASSARLAVD
ncbi:hypothetical protein Vretifemale_8664 [Volvox reticuliferus]|uniref:Uncharacterized protein n=1 Tax=Volvox reticuliferus TaxID=1737510 RepID=A0A8J4CEB5_9CHLO|nr:hypothetical protein Vretifemale_8664 [Volvox reticuliferus]